MTRNDSMFSATITSSSPGLKSPKALARQAQTEEDHKVDPKAEVIIRMIMAEKHEVSRTDTVLLDTKLSREEKLIRIERMQDQYRFLTRLENKFRKVLKLKAVDEVKV